MPASPLTLGYLRRHAAQFKFSPNSCPQPASCDFQAAQLYKHTGVHKPSLVLGFGFIFKSSDHQATHSGNFWKLFPFLCPHPQKLIWRNQNGGRGKNMHFNSEHLVYLQ